MGCGKRLPSDRVHPLRHPSRAARGAQRLGGRKTEKSARSPSPGNGRPRASLSPQRPIARCADAPFLLEDMGYGAMREREVWWLCPECGAAWRVTVDARRVGAACPVCGHATAGTPAA